MIIDQTKILDNISKNISNDNQEKGVSNFMKTANDKIKMASEEYKKHSKSGVMQPNNSVYKNPMMGQEKTVAEKIDEKSEMTAENRKNQMVVMSNTMSAEDYNNFQENGLSMSNSDSHVILSESDQIKAAMARTGADISKYGGLSAEEIEQATGNAAVSMQIQQALSRNDLPATEDNVNQMNESLTEACSIIEISEDAKSYLIKNNLDPIIENLYKASHSGKEIAASYQMENSISEDEFEEMLAQIEEIISSSGLENTEENIENAKWLIKNGISLNKENILYLNDLNDLVLPKDKVNEVINAMADAIVEGDRPKDAMLIKGYSITDKAKEILEVITNATDEDIEYCIENDLDINISNLELAHNALGMNDGINNNKNNSNHASSVDATNGINGANGINDSESKQLALVTAKRQLEEIRLMMTLDANLSMLKKGISIDTAELEKVVEELKQQEQNYYEGMLRLNNIEVTEGNIEVLSQTVSTFEELKYQPAYALSVEASEETPVQLLVKGQEIKNTFDQANQRYETMMTAPRADLGDNIHKAFRNVDDILDDLGIEKTEANQRAVRILAYNSTEITEENILKMKAADEAVQRAFSNMTPKVVMEMIRKGISPLDMSIEELNEVATEIRRENGDDEQQRFSKYLWKLEHNKEISEEERSSYIGIYRLIAQVEKTDGAVIGSLINQGADITMRNLLTAVRNSKKSGLDYEIDEDFAGVDSKIKGEKIDDQIQTAYLQNCVKDIFENISPEKLEGIDWENMTPEELKSAFEEVQTDDESLDLDFAKAKLDELQEAVSASDEVYELLERYDVTNTVNNVIAMSEMLRNPNKMFNSLLKTRMESESPLEMLEDFKEEILEAFGEAVKTPEEMAKAQEELAERAEHAMDSMIIENEEISTIDLKELQLMKTQFALCGKKAKEESFMIPVQTNDGVVGVSLKVIRGEENKGMVDIFFRGEMMGKIAASFEAKDGKITGVIAASDQETRDLLAENVGMIATNITLKSMEAVELSVALVPDLSSEKFEFSSIKKEQSLVKGDSEGKKDNEKNPVQTKRLYGVAESFIRSIEEFTL